MRIRFAAIFLFTIWLGNNALAADEIRAVEFGQAGMNDIRTAQLEDFDSSCRITIRHAFPSGGAQRVKFWNKSNGDLVVGSEGTEQNLPAGTELTYVIEFTKTKGPATQSIYCGGKIEVKDANPADPRAVVASATLVNFVQGIDGSVAATEGGDDDSEWKFYNVPIYTQTQVLINRGMAF